MGEPITQEGYVQIKKELQALISEVRPKLLQEIETAREHGDLKENAEYHAAKEKQSFVEGRIQELNGMIAEADIIDIKKIPKNRVVFGTKVRVLDEEKETEAVYQIVGKSEADMTNNKIAYNSPLAQALIGKQVDDLVEVKAPKGVREYSVLEIL